MVEISKLTFSYGDELVVKDVTINLGRGDILSIVGPSGCGKSTLLRLIAGILKADSGRVYLDEMTLDSVGLRFLFQDYDAFPWYTTWENVKHSATAKRLPSDEQVNKILGRVGLLESASKYPSELSGGMRKRLALARCLVTNPPLLLLDEPFAKLDYDTRFEMYALMQELRQEYNQSIILVTHDLSEAILLGSRILLATPRPFEIQELLDVPFKYPRTDSIVSAPEYWNIMQLLKNNLNKPHNISTLATGC